MLYDFVYLASASPRRAQLLAQAGIAYRPLLPDRNEDTETLEQDRRGALPVAFVVRGGLRTRAGARGRLARRGRPPAPILCADTTVALGRRILGKPRDDTHAAAMLRALSGRSHRVMTSVVVGHERLHHLATSTSRVRFAALSEATIRRYVASGEPRDKAGAYAVQGRIAAWIEHLEGSYTGIMGLPLHETITLLSRTRVRLEL